MLVDLFSAAALAVLSSSGFPGEGALNHGGATAQVPSSSGTAMQTEPSVGGALSVQQFGARGDNKSDDTAAIQRALDEAGEGRTVFFPPGRYRVTKTLSLQSGQKLVGAGYQWTKLEAGRGTEIRRDFDGVLLAATGASMRTGGRMFRNVEIRDLRLDGGNRAGDLLVLRSCSLCKFDNVQFAASRGRALLLEEVFDSRFNNCEFDILGSTDGASPAVELRSVAGREYTNQVHFVGCRWETYRGVALATSGINTNEIFLTNCKFESMVSNLPALRIHDAVVVNLDGVQVFSKGTAGVLSSQLEVRRSSGVFGTVFLEHSNSGIPITSFIDVANSNSIDLKIFVYGGEQLLTGPACLVTDSVSAPSTVVSGFIRPPNRTQKRLALGPGAPETCSNCFPQQLSPLALPFASGAHSMPRGRDIEKGASDWFAPLTESSGFRRSASAPTGNACGNGELVLNSAPIPGGHVGWVCVQMGPQRGWKPFGLIGK